MTAFKEEVSKMLTTDIMLILEDQLDLYSDEEIAVLKEELSKRSRSDEDLRKEKEIIYKEMEAEIEREEAEECQRMVQKQKKELESRINFLRSQGYKEYYEYTALTICDDSNGTVDVTEMVEKMNELALNGWKLVTAFANEIGKNSFTGGFGGISSGTNSTVEQNILLFERRISID